MASGGCKQVRVMTVVAQDALIPWVAWVLEGLQLQLLSVSACGHLQWGCGMSCMEQQVGLWVLRGFTG
eukprot:CAMPEP_0202883230 /NCGR_PEP_ID=MMETSP1391-20130828/39151_1 /ASSEMBLY_ACC=CAM_ASM_000867 /TAXON_ID=1034604 /ORGANISM="Chlamydomonas leiostraca, Strain SAG 11-49" /LENGTH=67 /DNA_ID=CAMNT_0049566213 /DNA_START=94 /DNA_END=294 /DNA_ORIENTATION=-